MNHNLQLFDWMLLLSNVVFLIFIEFRGDSRLIAPFIHKFSSMKLQCIHWPIDTMESNSNHHIVNWNHCFNSNNNKKSPINLYSTLFDLFYVDIYLTNYIHLIGSTQNENKVYSGCEQLCICYVCFNVHSYFSSISYFSTSAIFRTNSVDLLAYGLMLLFERNIHDTHTMYVLWWV